MVPLQFRQQDKSITAGHMDVGQDHGDVIQLAHQRQGSVGVSGVQNLVIVGTQDPNEHRTDLCVVIHHQNSAASRWGCWEGKTHHFETKPLAANRPSRLARTLDAS
jgi:hypothetical protein